MRLVVLCVFSAALAATVASRPGPSAIELAQERYEGARTLQARFLERYSENGRFVRAESGIAYFQRPGRMRWDYEVPEKNTFLVDGRYVWFYSPADRTATRMPAKQSEDWRTPLAFLTSHLKLSQLCSRIEQESPGTATQAGNVVFRCQLRGQGEEAKGEAGRRSGGPSRGVVFEVSPEGELRRIVVMDQGGEELEFSFTGWEWNPPLDKRVFEFTPPRGVAIVNGVLPEGPGARQ